MAVDSQQQKHPYPESCPVLGLGAIPSLRDVVMDSTWTRNGRGPLIVSTIPARSRYKASLGIMARSEHARQRPLPLLFLTNQLFFPMSRPASFLYPPSLIPAINMLRGRE